MRRIVFLLLSLAAAVPAAAGNRVLRDVAYGPDARQRFDVYAPDDARGAPVIFMLHGGAWAFGDKSAATVVGNKARALGAARLRVRLGQLPHAARRGAARAGARRGARACLGAGAGGFLGRRRRALHPDGTLGRRAPGLAHRRRAAHRARSGRAPLARARWRSTARRSTSSASCASATCACTTAHSAPIPRIGPRRRRWRACPQRGAPFLAVCSTRRADSCPAAQAFAAKARSLGTRASVLEENLSHREINAQLGEDGDYTRAVEAFLDALLR